MKEYKSEFFHSKRYKPLAKLGEGAMGVVLKCEDSSIKRIVAMKLLNKKPDDIKAARLQTEARAIAKLEHPNIIKILDFGLLEDGQLFLTMEYIEGESLEDRLHKLKALKLSDAVPLLKQICLGMKHSHDHGVLHRDLKPSNILIEKVSNDGTVKLVDFGIAKIEEGTALELTRTGAAVGSPPYMSPEAVRGEPVSKASDIYSFGCVLFEILTGDPPFLGESASATMMLHANAAPPTLLERSDIEFPDAIEKLAARCLAKREADRYKSFDEVLQDLENYENAVEDDDDDDDDEIDTRRSDKVPRTRKPVLAIAIFLAIALCSLLSMKNLFSNKEEGDKNREKLKAGKEVFLGNSVSIDSITGGKPHLKAEKSNAPGYYSVMGDVDGRKSDLAFLKDHNDIHTLLFRMDNLKGDTLEAAAHLPLRKLKLMESEIDSRALKIIAEREGIETLDLIQCYGFKNEDLKVLTRLDKLKSFCIERSILTEKGLEPILRMKSLNTLVLTDNKSLKFSFLSKMKELPNITRLHISQNDIAAGDFAALKNNKTLKEMELSKLPGNYQEVLHSMKLENLTIKDSPEFTREEALSLATIPSLKSLRFIRCKHIGDSIRPEISKIRPGLDVDVSQKSRSGLEMIL
ncbi:MAG TPA: protein kinase [Candidatus Melainabacteria bacterium]|nr:protein kinase [Candidatus Melainabacteria bacterium]